MRCLGHCLALAPDHHGCATLRTWLRGVNASLATAARLETAGAPEDAIGELQSLMGLHDDDSGSSERAEESGTIERALRRVPMPQAMRRRVVSALCRLAASMADADGVVHWCGRVGRPGGGSTRSREDGEGRGAPIDAARLIEMAHALLHIARVRLQTYSLLAESEQRSHESELHAAANAFGTCQGRIQEANMMMARTAGDFITNPEKAAAAASLEALRGPLDAFGKELAAAQAVSAQRHRREQEAADARRREAEEKKREEEERRRQERGEDDSDGNGDGDEGSGEGDDGDGGGQRRSAGFRATDEDDLYDILGLDADCELSEIKSACELLPPPPHEII